MKVRIPMTGKARLQMIFWGSVVFVACITLWPHASTDAMQTFLGFGAILGPFAVLGGIVGVQEHRL